MSAPVFRKRLTGLAASSKIDPLDVAVAGWKSDENFIEWEIGKKRTTMGFIAIMLTRGTYGKEK